MDVERRDMEYNVILTTNEIRALIGFSDPDGNTLPLTANVRGPIEEVFSLTCDRTGQLSKNPRVVDHVLFERGQQGPEVTTDRRALIGLLLDDAFFVTRYYGENKIWIRREEKPRRQR